ncbi:MAG: leucine-rich repeat domain-containing protein [Dysgonamonadaceae bacterium]|nr:leucine-rich repeat domain-containing protein [Dysgonamonadaceae bacterium]
MPDFRIVDGVLSLYLGLGNNVIIPDSVVEIGDQAFHGGHRVTDVTIPEGVKKIGEYAFSESGLYAVSIPQSVTFLGHGAFMWCYNLKTIEVKWSLPLQMSGNNILNDDDYNKIKLIVPKGTKSLYRADAHWGRFSTIEENDYTGIQPVSAEATVSVSGNQLVVNSPAAETVSAYSITGSLLYSITKPAGEKRMDIQHIQNKICIVKGSSGWVKKLILND